MKSIFYHTAALITLAFLAGTTHSFLQIGMKAFTLAALVLWANAVYEYFWGAK